jgi:hypothetical protein
MANEQTRVIGEFSDYDELITVLRARASELNLSGPSIDSLSGLPDRYAQKLLGPNAVRRLGMTSLGPIYGALAVRALLIEDKAAAARIRSQTIPRNNSYVRGGVTHLALTTRFMQKIGRLGAQARIDNSTKAQRQEWARRAAVARWQGTR